MKNNNIHEIDVEKRLSFLERMLSAYAQRTCELENQLFFEKKRAGCGIIVDHFVESNDMV
jgi:hypothetical protein